MEKEQPDEHNSPEQSPGPQSLFEQARGAEKAGKQPEALQVYDQIIDTFKDNETAEEIVHLSRVLRASVQARMKSESMGPMRTLFAITIGFGVWILIGLGIFAIFSTDMRLWWVEHWLWVVIASAAVVALFSVSKWLEEKLAMKSESSRQAVLSFFVVPLITLTMMAVIALGASGMALALELILILVAALLPAVTYYLFIAVRRPSIFNEFLSNLSGLGLFSPHPVRQRVENEEGNVYVYLGYESSEERHARVEGYLQSFESIYGTLRFDTTDGYFISRADFVTNLLDSIDKRKRELQLPQTNVRLTDIFRATLVIPIGLVTILTTLGWLLTIQPEIVTIPQDPEMSLFSRIFETTPTSSDPGSTSVTTDQLSSAGANGGNASAGDSSAKDESGAVAATRQMHNPVAELLPAFTPAGFAFLGAYFFGIQMMFRRFVRRDLGPNAYMAFANRILLAWIATWVVLAIYSTLTAGPANVGQQATTLITAPLELSTQWPPAIIGLAFVLGVFPRMLWQFLNAFVTKVLPIKLVIPAVEVKQPLVELDGLTIWHEARLEEEDIENVPNMATVNVVDTLLHTQIPAERLISWIDQAILYSVLGPEPKCNDDQKPVTRREKLRKLGIRNATQIVEAWNGSAEEQAAIKGALGDEAGATIVRGTQIESNFSVVHAWRAGTKYG